MVGSKRLRKKAIKEAGWEIVNESYDENGAHLELLNAEGSPVKIDASSAPQAYLQAAEMVKMQG